MKTIQTTFLGLVIVFLIGCVCAERCKVTIQTVKSRQLYANVDKSARTYQQVPRFLPTENLHIYSKTYRVTAYCPCEKCCGKWANVYPRRTASGHIIKDGDRFAAADKNIPFGTILDIPGYGIVRVEDRGGAIKGNRLDVFFPTHQAALNWGMKNLTVKEIK